VSVGGVVVGGTDVGVAVGAGDGVRVGVGGAGGSVRVTVGGAGGGVPVGVGAVARVPGSGPAGSGAFVGVASVCVSLGGVAPSLAVVAGGASVALDPTRPEQPASTRRSATATAAVGRRGTIVGRCKPT
jgi:hypothetical protein